MGDTQVDSIFAGILLLQEKLAIVVVGALGQVDRGELTPKNGLTKIKEVIDEVQIHIGQSESKKIIWHCMMQLCQEACARLNNKMS